MLGLARQCSYTRCYINKTLCLSHKPTPGFNSKRAAFLLWLRPRGCLQVALVRDCPCTHIWLMRTRCQECAIASHGLTCCVSSCPNRGETESVCLFHALNNLLAVSLRAAAASPPRQSSPLAYICFSPTEKGREKHFKKPRKMGLQNHKHCWKGDSGSSRKFLTHFRKWIRFQAAGRAWCCLNDIYWMGSVSYCSWVPV